MRMGYRKKAFILSLLCHDTTKDIEPFSTLADPLFRLTTLTERCELLSYIYFDIQS